MATQRPLSVLSIDTSHSDITRRNSASLIHHPNSTVHNMSHEELTSKIADSFQEFSNMLSQLSSCKSNIAPSPMTPPLVPPVAHPKSASRRQACNHAEPLLSPPTTTIGQNQSKGQLKGKVRAKEALRKEKNDSNKSNSNNDNNNIISSNSSSSTSSTGSHNNNNENPTCFEKVNVLLLNGMHNVESEQPHSVIAKCLTIASSNGRADILEKMLERNVDLNCTDNEASGITPLMYAAYFGRISCLHLLLQHSSIKVNKQDKNGWTALTWAVSGSQVEAVQLLLKHGAKAIKTKSGRSLFEFPTCEAIKDLIGSPPPAAKITEHPPIEQKKVDNQEESTAMDLYYQTPVDGYNHFANFSPKQPIQEKDTDVIQDNDGWESSVLKSTVTFDWSRCLPDQMLVFTGVQVPLIMDQVFGVTSDTIRSLSRQHPLSNELWAPANTLFLCARFAHYCSSRELLSSLLDAATNRLSKVTKNASRNTHSLCFWIANTCQLVSYLKKDTGLSIVTEDVQEVFSKSIAEAYTLFVTESQKMMEKMLVPTLMEHDPIQEHVEYADDWQRFFFRRNSSSTITVEPTSQASPQTMTHLLGHLQYVLQSYHVPAAIVIQAMAQFFYYLSCELFNRILSNRKYLCRSKALQIRLNLSTLEEWVRDHKLPSSLNHAFDPVVQLLQLLQCLTQMTDIETFTSTVSTFDKLNPLQVKRCVQKYRYEVNEPKLPECIEQLAAQMAASLPENKGRRSLNLSDSKRSSISSLNSLITPKSKRASISELEDDDLGADEEESETRNSKYLLPFSVFSTTALLQNWTEEKQKRLVHHSYSEAIYREIKLKKLETLDLLDKIMPSLPDEWLSDLDRKLRRMSAK
ncbi:hypothetical protein CU097_013763 [Rhizopus azygosporus]|nr:hypothetical protein CU097_013763 [Rhizopus azygosporus]